MVCFGTGLKVADINVRVNATLSFDNNDKIMVDYARNIE
jgi:hypothetical protein